MTATSAFHTDLVPCAKPSGSDVVANVWFALSLTALIATLVVMRLTMTSPDTYLSVAEVTDAPGYAARPLSAVPAPPTFGSASVAPAPIAVYSNEPAQAQYSSQDVAAATAATAAAAAAAAAAAVASMQALSTVPRTTVSIVPERVRYHPATSLALVGARDNPVLSGGALLTDASLQRGVPFTRAGHRDGQMAMALLLFAEIVLVVATLAPLVLWSHPLADTVGLMYCLPADFFLMNALIVIFGFPLWITQRRLGSALARKQRSLALCPAITASVFFVPAAALVIFFTLRGFDAGIGWRFGLTRSWPSVPVRGGPGAQFTFSFGLFYSIFSLVLVTTTARTAGLALANPAARRDPGLPINFTDEYQDLLVEYLTRSEMNQRPERAVGLSLQDVALRRRFA